MASTPTLAFLRPLPLPLPSSSFAKLFLRQIAGTTCRRQQEASAMHSNTLSKVQRQSSEPTYFVHRTASQELPVYQRREQGTKLTTMVQKIDGDIIALRDQLKKELRIKEGHIAANMITKKIKIKGFRRMEVKTFLESQRF